MTRKILFTLEPDKAQERYYYLVEDYNPKMGKWTPYCEVDKLRRAKYWATYVTTQGRSARVSKVTRGAS